MAKYIYIVEISEIQTTGLNGNVYQRYYCKSNKDANICIEGMIATNKGFDVNEEPVQDISAADGYIRSLNYKWDSHKQGCSNLHIPQRDVLTNVQVKKVRLQYT
ncbi:MAG: hypothetical protein ACOC22_00845 [bacterium]